jgi:diguanylate cyclase (GGDEF)-like protein
MLMDIDTSEIKELHWMMEMLDSINVGLVVIDTEYKIHIWNEFMVNHSGIQSSKAIEQVVYDLFAEIPKSWFKQKVNSVITLQNNAFSTWEQRPYLFKFSNFHPITGAVELMYQNITFIPLVAANAEVSHIGIVIYDATDNAVSTMELEAANNELKKLSRIDRLTTLNNRGYWEECLQHEFLRVKRTRQSSSLIMFDIDHFKNVNDTYGHQAGDEVIRQTSAILRETIRETDIPGRYGGEEFAVILIDTPLNKALILAERLRKNIEAITVTYEDMKIRFTISIGIAEISDDIKTYEQWLECSDKALYQSKESGRNQSSIYKCA